ncbi:MAG: hypothetical protein WAT79_10015 [Saprospiraceae bacterium]
MQKLILSKYLDFNKVFNKKIIRNFFVYNLLNLDSIEDNSSIISTVSVTNGTAKTTYSKRFDDLNEMLLKFIDKNSEVLIHDVAVSNGITSLELFEFLSMKGYKINLHFSDKFTKIFFHKEHNETFFYDVDGNYIFGYIRKILASKYVSNFFFGTKFLYSLSEKKAKEMFNYQLPTILLLHSKVIKASENNNLFQFIDHDLFNDASPLKYDIIRAVNILNPIYFTENQINKALRLTHSSLQEDGIFLVGRTHIEDGKNHASFYRKSNAGFVLIEHHNAGSEIGKLIENVNILDGSIL